MPTEYAICFARAPIRYLRLPRCPRGAAAWAILRRRVRRGNLAGTVTVRYAPGMSTVLEVVPAGVFSTAYEVLADGQPKGRIEHRILSLRDEAVITTPNHTFTAHRPRVFRAGAVLESAGGTLRAKADKEGFWRENYKVRFGDAVLYLRQKVWSLRGVFLISDPSDEIGSIRLQKAFSRRMLVEYAVDTPPPLEITEFLVWIVLMVQRRQAAAA